MEILTKCECGNNVFKTIGSTEIYLKLNKKGILTSFSKDDLGSDGIYECVECDKQYSPSEFEKIIIK